MERPKVFLSPVSGLVYNPYEPHDRVGAFTISMSFIG
jgi:hypothetical protein